MFGKTSSLALVLTSAAVLQQAAAFPAFGANTVVYLTNCATSDTNAPYSEVSIYSDVTQSFGGQEPDAYADTFLGQDQTWEGNQVTWLFPPVDPTLQQDSFRETINGNAQDPSVPVFTQVGCGSYDEGFKGGAVAWQFNCYKDNPRVLYTAPDHQCQTVYYCTNTPTICQLSASSGAATQQRKPVLVKQGNELK